MKSDLNLLLVFDAVARFGSVSRAAQHLALSQPAVSHALNRLRAAVGDPLFTRAGRGLVPTPRAEAMMAPVRALVIEAAEMISPQEFTPATAQKLFRIGASDYAAFTLIPALMRHLGHAAPAVQIELHPAGAGALAALESGQLDLSFWGTEPPPKPFHHLTLFEETYIGIARAGHPVLAEGPVTLEGYLAHPHAVVALQVPGANAIDRALAQRGLSRRVGLMSHSFAGNLAALPHCDLIASLPARLCQPLPPGLSRFDLPLAVPAYRYGIVWHPRTERIASHRWLRGVLARTAQE